MAVQSLQLASLRGMDSDGIIFLVIVYLFLTLHRATTCLWRPLWSGTTVGRLRQVRLYITLPSFIKIGHELFEINRIKTHRHTHRHTDTHTDTYTPMKIIPFQKQKFLGQVISVVECSANLI